MTAQRLGNIALITIFGLFVLSLIIGAIIEISRDLKYKQSHDSPVGQLLKGEHELKAIRTQERQNLSGGFFLFCGSISGSTKSNVRFCWKNNEGTYTISELPIDDFQVKLVQETCIPTIKFRWSKSNYGYEYTYKNAMSYVKYCVITCNEKDWVIEKPTLTNLQ